MCHIMADIEERSQDSSSRDTGHIKPGIIYLSRIPPYMRPLKIRHVFSKYGKVGRIYLQPEGEPTHESIKMSTSFIFRSIGKKTSEEIWWK